jgi:uncharacterized protein
MLLPRGKRWIQSRLTLLALLGLSTVCFSGMAIFCWPMRWWGWWLAHGARCAHIKTLFNTGVVLYVIGIAVLVLLGMISGDAPNRSWVPDAANLQYEQYWKLNGGLEAVSNRADMLSDNLLALGRSTAGSWRG